MFKNTSLPPQLWPLVEMLELFHVCEKTLSIVKNGKLDKCLANTGMCAPLHGTDVFRSSKNRMSGRLTLKGTQVYKCKVTGNQILFI